MTKPKTKKIVIYIDEETGSYFIRATRRTGDPKGYVTKDERYGKSISARVSNAKLGETIREIIANCD